MTRSFIIANSTVDSFILMSVILYLAQVSPFICLIKNYLIKTYFIFIYLLIIVYISKGFI